VNAIAAIAALPLSAAIIWATLRVRPRRLVAAPSGDRWHDRETPVGGGIGIVAGLVGGVALCVAVGAVETSSELLGVLAGCLVLFVAGLVDDVRSLPPLAKLAAQFAAAGIALWSGLTVAIVGNDLLAAAIGLVWLVGMTNAFNLLDNMDGLAATLAAIAAGYFAIDAATVHANDTVLVLALSLAFACAGFLPFNVRPRGRAAIFMGDSGSQVLGFALASLGLLASWNVAGTTVARSRTAASRRRPVRRPRRRRGGLPRVGRARVARHRRGSPAARAARRRRARRSGRPRRRPATAPGGSPRR
jgi:UDP-GlcNAc:undecaprenyl-phosphate GlcNAc-1-phosphate transferase